MSKISKERRTLFYLGRTLMVIGFLLFISVFFSVFSFNIEGAFTAFIRAPIGMLLIIVGGIMSNIGERGAAGSGMILDPEQAREDLRPFNEARGGMIGDVIRNIEGLDDIIPSGEKREVIKIRCPYCSTLNEEDAKFCKSCGKQI